MLAFDLPLGFDASDSQQRAAAAEAAGCDGVWSAEAGHDPYLPLALAAAATSRITVGSAIAVAFARSPLVHAQAGWDLHRMAPGRFVLGLGSQVRAHNQKRYSAPADHPVARMRDMVRAIKAIWHCWQSGERLNYRGEFYTHTLMTPFFNPGPVDHPTPPPIYVAAVSKPMLAMAGAEAEGIHVHPLHTERSLDMLTLPTATAAAAGRSLTFVVPAMIATGPTEEDVRDAREGMRAQISFYASTPAYREVLDIEGKGEVADELHHLSRQQRWSEMPALVDDELLDAVCISATWDNVAAALVARYASRAQRIMPYSIDTATPWADIAAAVRTHAESATA